MADHQYQQQQQQHHHQHLQQQLQRHHQHHHHEFLPLCDVLFNIISLASYFCDVVFDLAMAYALAHHSGAPASLFPLSILFVFTSLVVSQIVSVKWYLWGARGKLRVNATTSSGSNSATDIASGTEGKKTASWTLGCVLTLHVAQAGVLWRYFKLFIPVDLSYVKHEVRELCVLRLIHAFCEAAPMLLLQVYLLAVGSNEPTSVSEHLDASVDAIRPSRAASSAKLCAISAGLSLWSVCWAVASFSKSAARLRNIERLVLTWLGVLAQLAWRLGAVSARIGALVAYASIYGAEWLLVVVALHWLSMLTWLLLTPDGLFHAKEKLAPTRKFCVASMLAFVYVFSYVNLHEANHRQKMVIFYSVMFLENSLLMGVWAVGVGGSEIYRNVKPVTLVLGLYALFFGGLFFMGLYYRFFHVRRLRYESGGRMNATATTLPHLRNNHGCSEKCLQNGGTGLAHRDDKYCGARKTKLHNAGIPGVFNCRFANPAVTNPNRKKKKPTTFVPPPSSIPMTQAALSQRQQQQHAGDSKWAASGNGGPQLIPFWKRPLSIASCNNDDDDDNSRGDKNSSDLTIGGSLSVNLIHEKLREKKQQQLRELRAIQEEIREGKLVPPPSSTSSATTATMTNDSPTNQPPNTKLHATAATLQNGWPPVKMHCAMPPPPAQPYRNGAGYEWAKRSPAEILLTPKCLPYHFSHYSPQLTSTGRRLCNDDENDLGETSKDENQPEDDDLSDLEGSQISLPRSYTLPREFKYHNGKSSDRDTSSRYNGSRYYLPSTNSSDGDVDSADNEEETDSELPIGGSNKLQVRSPASSKHNSSNHHQRNYSNVESEANNCSSSSSAWTNGGLHPSLSCGMLRANNQAPRTKVKHETKL